MSGEKYTVIEIRLHDSAPDREGCSIEAYAAAKLSIATGAVRTGILYYFSSALPAGRVEWFAENALAAPPLLVALTGGAVAECGQGSFLLREARPGRFDPAQAAARCMFQDFDSRPRSFEERLVFTRKIFYFANRLSPASMLRIANVLLGGDSYVFTPFEARGGDVSYPAAKAKFAPRKSPASFDLTGSEEGLGERGAAMGLELTRTELMILRNHFTAARTASSRRQLGLPPDPTFSEIKFIEQAKLIDFNSSALAASVEFVGPDGFRRAAVGSVYTDFIKRACELAAEKNGRGAVAIKKSVVRDDGRAAEIYSAGDSGIWPGDVLYAAGAAAGFDGIEGALEICERRSGEKFFAECPDDPLLENAIENFLKRAVAENLLRAAVRVSGGGIARAAARLASISGGVSLEAFRIPARHEKMSAREKLFSESPGRALVAVPKECAAEIAALARDFGVPLADAGSFNDSGAVEITDGEARIGRLDLELLGKIAAKRNVRVEIPADEPPPEPVFHAGEMVAFINKLVNFVSDEERELFSLASRYFNPDGDIGESFADSIRREKISPKEMTVGLTALAAARAGSYHDAARCAVAAADLAMRRAVASGAPLPASGDGRRKPFAFDVAVFTPALGAAAPGAVERERVGLCAAACEGLAEFASFFGITFGAVTDVAPLPLRREGRGGALPLFILHAMTQTARPGYLMSPYFRAAGDAVYAIGPGRGSLGGSAAFEVSGIRARHPDARDFEETLILYMKVASAAENGLFVSCAPVGRGGAFFAAFTAAAGSGLGAALDPRCHPDDLAGTLFSENGSCFVISARPESAPKLEAIFGSALTRLGTVEGFDDPRRPCSVSIRSEGRIAARVEMDSLKKLAGRLSW